MKLLGQLNNFKNGKLFDAKHSTDTRLTPDSFISIRRKVFILFSTWGKEPISFPLISIFSVCFVKSWTFSITFNSFAYCSSSFSTPPYGCFSSLLFDGTYYIYSLFRSNINILKNYFQKNEYLIKKQSIDFPQPFLM